MNESIHVVAAVIVKDDKYLCAQRNNTKNLAYKWEFPGGKVEQNENIEAALHREIKEELNCDISIRQHFLTTQHNYSFATVKIDVFLCSLLNNEPECIEHNDLKWLDKKSLASLDWADADLPIVSWLINNTEQ